MNTGLFPAILGIGPWPKLGKNEDLTSKLGEINDIEHNKDSKMYPQNQVTDYGFLSYTSKFDANDQQGLMGH